VTYLAVEISLYLACAALTGICLGWLFWGRSYQRRVAEMHEEMTTSLEAERNLNDEVRHELKDAQAKLDKAIQSEKAKSSKAIADVQKLLESEKEASRSIRADAEQLRLDMDAAINAEKTSASNAIQEAMQHAESLKATVDEAKTKETQIQAELEELRLMAGAEKLASQSARAEAEQLRRDMQTSLNAERETSRAARQALDDIRGTLARTFGEGAGAIAALSAQPETLAIEPAAISDGMQSKTEEIGDSDLADATEKPEAEKPEEDALPPEVDKPLKLPGIEVEPGTAFDVLDKEATRSDEPAPVGMLIASSDTNVEHEVDGTPPLGDEDSDSPDPDGSVTIEPNQLDLSATIDAQPPDQEERTRPSSFYAKRPDEVDSLQEIGGIDSDIERLLNESGCFQFKQLADFSDDDIDWLSRTLPDMPDLKERIARDGWIEQARELQVKKYMTANADRPRWWSRSRLQ
jgi:predicted flap endonuclease-1-like 5' DNA nuclease